MYIILIATYFARHSTVFVLLTVCIGIGFKGMSAPEFVPMCGG